MTASIAENAKSCFRNFEQLKAAANLDGQPLLDVSPSLIHDELERFRIWLGNSGASQQFQSKSSLEYRLRDTRKLTHQVEELLDDLQEGLNDALSIFSGERPNQTGSTFGEGDDLPSGNDGIGAEELSEVKESLLLIHDSIGSLFRISVIIQNATPRDRFSKALANAHSKFDESYDIAHVGHKFPILNKPGSEWLKYRLGKAITQRRQYLRYCREHRDKKARGHAADSPEAQSIALEEREHHEAARKSEFKSQTEGRSIAQPPSTLPQTTASTLMVSKLDSIDATSEAGQTETSFATSLGDQESSQTIMVSQLKDICKDHSLFECPYCWGIQTVKSQRSWKKHVFQDLRPYVCTFKDCDLKLFPDRRAWFDHESKSHRLEWKCSFCDHVPYDSSKKFQKHLQQLHQGNVPDVAMQAFLQSSQRQLQYIAPHECPFCDEWDETLRTANSEISSHQDLVVTPTQFSKHVGSHMEQLAFFAIPRGYEEDGDADSADVAAGSKGSSALLSSETHIPIPAFSIRDESDPLMLAAWAGDTDAVIRMVEDEKANPDIKGVSNNTPLHYAVRWDKREIVLSLIKFRSQFYAQNDDGETILHIAAARKPEGVDILKTLLDHVLLQDVNVLEMPSTPNSVKDLDTQDQKGATPLHHAIENGNGNCALALLNRGASVHCRDKTGRSAVHYAIKSLYEPMIPIILGEGGADVNAIDDFHQTALHMGIMQNAPLPVIEALLDHKPDLEATTLARETALQLAVKGSGSSTVALYLLGNGANPRVRDNVGRSPLHWAAYNGDSACAESLLRYENDPGNVPVKSPSWLTWDRSGMCPLHLATGQGHSDMISLLLPYVKDIDSLTAQGASALHIAAEKGDMQIVELLLNKNAQVNLADGQGRSPLYLAVENGHSNIYPILITRGASTSTLTAAVARQPIESQTEPDYQKPLDRAAQHDNSQESGTDKTHQDILLIPRPHLSVPIGTSEDDRSADSKPTRYTMIRHELLDPETLDTYELPWQWSEGNFMVKRWVSQPDQDILIEHTRQLRSQKQRSVPEIQAATRLKLEDPYAYIPPATNLNTKLEPDSVIDVDIGDGKPAIRFVYSPTMAPNEVANYFLEQYKLPKHYLHQLESFVIRRNMKHDSEKSLKGREVALLCLGPPMSDDSAQLSSVIPGANARTPASSGIEDFPEYDSHATVLQDVQQLAGLHSPRSQLASLNNSERDWPPGVRDYVQRCFLEQNMVRGITRSDIEAELKKIILRAAASGQLYVIDWDHLPLPQQKFQAVRSGLNLMAAPAAATDADDDDYEDDDNSDRSRDRVQDPVPIDVREQVQRAKKRLHRDQIERLKPILEEMFRDGYSIAEIKQKMENVYDFHSTMKEYEDQFKEWSLTRQEASYVPEHCHDVDLSLLFDFFPRNRSVPTEEDMRPANKVFIPVEQSIRFEDDLYTPVYVRTRGGKLVEEGFCGICQPGCWKVLANYGYWDHMTFTHGINSNTGLAFGKPEVCRKKDNDPNIWEGLCGSCNGWIELTPCKTKGTLWFKHAYKCHTEGSHTGGKSQIILSATKYPDIGAVGAATPSSPKQREERTSLELDQSEGRFHVDGQRSISSPTPPQDGSHSSPTPLYRGFFFGTAHSPKGAIWSWQNIRRDPMNDKTQAELASMVQHERSRGHDPDNYHFANDWNGWKRGHYEQLLQDHADAETNPDVEWKPAMIKFISRKFREDHTTGGMQIILQCVPKAAKNMIEAPATISVSGLDTGLSKKEGIANRSKEIERDVGSGETAVTKDDTSDHFRIGKKAADLAAGRNEQQYRQYDSSEGDDLSEEETLETRVGRIRDRVAELTHMNEVKAGETVEPATEPHAFSQNLDYSIDRRMIDFPDLGTKGRNRLPIRRREKGPRRIDDFEDGESSEEKTLESRIRRIRSRVAELTGNSAVPGITERSSIGTEEESKDDGSEGVADGESVEKEGLDS